MYYCFGWIWFLGCGSKRYSNFNITTIREVKLPLDLPLVTYGVHIESFWTEGYGGQTLNNGHELSIYYKSTVKLCWHNFTQSAPTYWPILIKRIFQKCCFWKIYIFWLTSPNRGHWLCCHNFSQSAHIMIFCVFNISYRPTHLCLLNKVQEPYNIINF